MYTMYKGAIPMPDHLLETTKIGDVELRNDSLASDFGYLHNQIMQDMMSAGAIPMDSRMDSAFGGNSIIFALETQHMLRRIINRPYPELKARRLIPQQSEVPVGATSFAFPIYDQVGEVKPIANYADDLPATDVIAEKHLVEPVDEGSSFNYSVRDIEIAAMANKPLSTMKAQSTAIFLSVKSIVLVGLVSLKQKACTAFLITPTLQRHLRPTVLAALPTGNQDS